MATMTTTLMNISLNAMAAISWRMRPASRPRISAMRLIEKESSGKSQGLEREGEVRKREVGSGAWVVAPADLCDPVTL